MECRKIFRGEIWKKITNFPGYEVSNYGQVRSYHKQGDMHKVVMDTPQRILKPGKTNGRRWHVTLRKDGVSYIITIHRLVLTAFVGPCPEGMEACHNDGNAFNNKIQNLRWDTHKNNKQDQIKHDTTTRGERNGNAKLSNEDIIKIRELGGVLTLTEIGNIFNVSRQLIHQIIKRKTWKHI